jgi:hemerythrin-like domain-containing protein
MALLNITGSTDMNIMSLLSSSATRMIRMDHTHVLSAFHKYEVDTPPATKEALVKTICLALEIHAQLEEELFYPAMREVDAALVDKAEPEHDTMRHLISKLRSMEPTHAAYDATLMELMRDVMHHVADEETTMLPAAERLLADRLNELGAQMTKRRLELAKPHAGEIAWNTARAMPASTMLIGAGALVAGSYLLKHALRR